MSRDDPWQMLAARKRVPSNALLDVAYDVLTRITEEDMFVAPNGICLDCNNREPLYNDEGDNSENWHEEDCVVRVIHGWLAQYDDMKQ